MDEEKIVEPVITKEEVKYSRETKRKLTKCNDYLCDLVSRYETFKRDNSEDLAGQALIFARLRKEWSTFAYKENHKNMDYALNTEAFIKAIRHYESTILGK